mmetsp:Transcript_13974/g.48243  ORF Transcript_13974/g.48243 Transcript_13974/m.48243 type:complete len:200 (-) Transcript_13974:26-625(-)
MRSILHALCASFRLHLLQRRLVHMCAGPLRGSSGRREGHRLHRRALPRRARRHHRNGASMPQRPGHVAGQACFAVWTCDGGDLQEAVEEEHWDRKVLGGCRAEEDHPRGRRRREHAGGAEAGEEEGIAHVFRARCKRRVCGWGASDGKSLAVCCSWTVEDAEKHTWRTFGGGIEEGRGRGKGRENVGGRVRNVQSCKCL